MIRNTAATAFTAPAIAASHEASAADTARFG